MSENTQSAMSEGSAYEVLKSRLSQQGQQLKALVNTLNEQRQSLFGGNEMQLVGKANVQTSARCVPIDMAQVSNQLLFGFYVKVGLKTVPSIHDVFGLYQLHENEGIFRLEPIPIEGSFLTDERFAHEFTELFTYYSDAKLSQIARQENILYIAFQIGMRPEDRKVFRFQINAHSIEYLDSLGHNSLQSASQHDFEWQLTDRSHHVLGTHPHVSIEDKVFVECVGGDLTIKIEDNTEDGKGIYQEEVEDPHQSVADADISYAIVGDLICLKIKPNREKSFRYFIYNPLTQAVTRADALGRCAKALPEEHGILFSHGYVLASGESKLFDIDWAHLEFFQMMASPNGEDIIYYFFNVVRGTYVSFSYNIIEKQFSNPQKSSGFSLYPDGQMLLFDTTETIEASTIHPLRIWSTPYSTPEYYASQTGQGDKTSPLFNLGNAELVRALSEVISICHLADKKDVTQVAFEMLLKQCNTTLDHYHWLNLSYAHGIGKFIHDIVDTADKMIDEFAKVQQLQQHALESIADKEENIRALIGQIKLTPKDQADKLISLLAQVKENIGSTMVLKQQHYADINKVENLVSLLNSERDELNHQLLSLLQREKSYQPYKDAILSIESSVAETEKTSELNELQARLDKLRSEIQMVTEEVTQIETDDPTESTRILDLTTEVTSLLNAASAKLRQKAGGLRISEAQAEFSAQFKLLAQSVNTAMEQAVTPDQCDEQMAKLLAQLDKLESRFADFDQFLSEIYAKRDEIQSILDSHKQQLISARQRRIQNLEKAANVTLSSIEKRISHFEDVAQLNSYFATDAMVTKLKSLSESVRQLGDSVKSDSIESKLKALQDQSLRSLRDNQDIFESGGKVLRLGKHRFSVNQQPLELSLVEHNDQLSTHIAGTDFYQVVDDEAFLAMQNVARLDVMSESELVYRGEYLAHLILSEAQNKKDSNITFDSLVEAVKLGTLNSIVQKFAAPRYREGYVKGIHDHDASIILEKILPIYNEAGLLRYSQQARANALLWLLECDDVTRWSKTAENTVLLRTHLHSSEAFDLLKAELAEQIGSRHCLESAEYLIHLIAQNPLQIIVSQDAYELYQDYLQFRRSLGWKPSDVTAIKAFNDHIQWLTPYTKQKGYGASFITEAAAIAVCKQYSSYSVSTLDFSLTTSVSGLLGEHERIPKGEIVIVLDDFIERCENHKSVVVPQFEQYLSKRTTLLNAAKSDFRLNEFKPRPLTSFVRNKLISESYLPLIGDNFAKQMGTLGDKKRTDLMGMLLLISPPGYGKTTLIEYVAHKLGLVFMKINGPSLGHQVTSLDPNDAPDQNAAREVEKINLALEMGNNVLLYLDDIQHTNPEFLQKFISLCDGTRRIEGSWKGKTKTYDMRGKKFAVVMAGNPYTESGEAFKIPDMLANRADIYNLGDMLSDQKESFALSFIENSLTSNSVLAPLANRDLQDVYRFVAMAQGETIPLSDMSYSYSAIESNEIISTLHKMLDIQKVILKVNQQYIKSAATADDYRTEPAFKLQGSYRNMNKLAEKISAVMTDTEINTLVQDHYQGEAQTLANGTEENLLKLAELRGVLASEQKKRWDEIKESYQRQQLLGDSEDRAGQVVQQLAMLNQYVSKFAYAVKGEDK